MDVQVTFKRAEGIKHEKGCPKTVTVSPEWMAVNGTPICNCGDDMEYVETKVVGDIILVYEVKMGTHCNHKVFTDNATAESHFIECLRGNADLSEDEIRVCLDNGFFDSEDGYEVVICHPDMYK